MRSTLSRTISQPIARLIARVGAKASVWLTGVVASAFAAVYCVARRWMIGDGFGAFVLAGHSWTDAASTPTPILVKHHVGFDGQFFYRLAHAPWRVEMGRVFGVRFDYAARSGRVTYPFLAWLASFGGRPGLVPGALVVVNVVAIGCLAAVGAALARDHGRNAWWGLAVACYWGFAIVIGRDVADLVAALGVCAMLLAVGRGRFWWASVAAVFAVMTREQAVLAVAAVAIGVLWHDRPLVGGREALSRAARIALPAAAIFVGWQSWVASITGDVPATSSSSANSTWPFADLPSALVVWARDCRDVLFGDLDSRRIIALPTFVMMVVLVVAAVTSGAMRRAWSSRPWEVLVGVVGLLVLVSSTHNVFDMPAEFRQSSDVATVSWLVLWQTDERHDGWRRWALVAFVPCTLAVFLFRTVVR